VKRLRFLVRAHLADFFGQRGLETNNEGLYVLNRFSGPYLGNEVPSETKVKAAPSPQLPLKLKSVCLKAYSDMRTNAAPLRSRNLAVAL
jgi:hypothetical protein